ncbi:MAG TPA: SDR family oxidoreductase [Miltoncostaeaceae bacterium]|nr:SDR family oxidoreductase [Miltoncostaeaceae bacterium]
MAPAEDPAPATGTVLLTGATGYVGGRLLAHLEMLGVPLRCMARRPGELRPRTAEGTEVVYGDVADPPSLAPAMAGIDVAYYLIHSMSGAADYRRADRAGAEAFGAAARAAGVRRIVYLGGLGEGPDLSPHLASRQEVGQVLAASGVPTVELRAGIVIGSGSTSFEMIRALVDRLPVMITPRWVTTRTQPIAIEDVVACLAAAGRVAIDGGRILEIGGPDRVSYGELMREYARQRGLRRLMIPVPVLTPRLSSLWLGLVTPVYARVGRELVEGLRNETVVADPAPARELLGVQPRGVRDAIARALVNEDREFAATRWSDALSSGPAPREGGAHGSRLIDSRVERVPAPPSVAFRPIRRIGGGSGWYYGNALWRFRGLVDLPFGGAGMRRGRRDPDRLLPGDTVDSWRVEAIEQDRLLRLSAEMWVPGRAWLQFEVEPDGDGSLIRQTAVFDPAGLLGRLYWYAVSPFHRFVFRGMVRGIARAAMASHTSANHEEVHA